MALDKGKKTAAQLKKEAEATQAEATQADAAQAEPVQVMAVFNRMRNPHTLAVFTKHKATDVLDLQSKENAWTRDQIAAKVLRIVKK